MLLRTANNIYNENIENESGKEIRRTVSLKPGALVFTRPQNARPIYA